MLHSYRRCESQGRYLKNTYLFLSVRKVFIISSTKGTVVIYKSKYGSSKRYAKWIAQNINCDG